MDIAAGSLHRPDGVDKGRVGAGVRVWIGLAGVGGGHHGARLRGVRLEANVGDVGGVALQGTKLRALLKSEGLGSFMRKDRT